VNRFDGAGPERAIEHTDAHSLPRCDAEHIQQMSGACTGEGDAGVTTTIAVLQQDEIHWLPLSDDRGVCGSAWFLEQVVGGPARLFGMSDGAIVALHVAMKRPLLVMAGDDDEMDPEHTLALYQGLPVGELAIVPGTSHGFLVEKPDICNALLLEFLTRDAVQTFAPIRRA